MSVARSKPWNTTQPREAQKRKMVIYTPLGYKKEATYPVLYLLHGIGDDETGWWQKGAANAILDNLAAEKKIVPMIVVMPNGRAAGASKPAADGPGGSPGGRGGRGNQMGTSGPLMSIY